MNRQEAQSLERISYGVHTKSSDIHLNQIIGIVLFLSSHFKQQFDISRILIFLFFWIFGLLEIRSSGNKIAFDGVEVWKWLVSSKKTGLVNLCEKSLQQMHNVCGPCSANRNYKHPESSRKDITITKPSREEIVHPYSL